MRQNRRYGTIQNKILVITLSCLLGMCVIISSVSYYLFLNYLQHSLIQGTETSLRLLSDSIDENLGDIYRMVRFCQFNSNIADYIEKNPNPGSVLSVATYDRIAEEFNYNHSAGYMTRLAVITGEHFLQIVSASYSSTSNLAAEVPALPFFEDMLSGEKGDFSTGFIKDPFYRNGKSVLPLLRPITYKYNSVQGGFLFIEVSSDLFTDAFDRYAASADSPLVLTICDHHYLYENGLLTEKPGSYKIIGSISSPAAVSDLHVTKARDADGRERLIVTAPLRTPGCYVSQVISYTELRSQQLILLGILCGVLISILGIGVLLAFILNRMISIPVIKINDKMRRISEGDFSRDESIEWNHELGDIGRGINDLSENLYLLMNRRLEDEKQKKDLEYKMLQSQINPHFLYNTLNSIKWMATAQGAEGISEMTTALAKLLKSISKGTSLLVPIREELSLLRDYFTIQSYRYGGTVSMDVRVDDDTILDMAILKFTLQPLIENAIFHGIEPKGSGHIDIHLYYENQTIRADAPSVSDDDPAVSGTDLITSGDAPTVRIDVTDDGIGISPEKAEQILRSNDDSRSDFFREIGVSNVHKRLQYEFGSRYGISIESEEGEYTTMAIRLPAREQP